MCLFFTFINFVMYYCLVINLILNWMSFSNYWIAQTNEDNDCEDMLIIGYTKKIKQTTANLIPKEIIPTIKSYHLAKTTNQFQTKTFFAKLSSTNHHPLLSTVLLQNSQTSTKIAITWSVSGPTMWFLDTSQRLTVRIKRLKNV